METRIQAFYPSPSGMKFITIFGYSTKGVPGLEINGMGKFGKNLKEKIVYLNRIRKIRMPVRRIVISLDVNDLDPAASSRQLKWLELPALLTFWHLIGVVQAATLQDCLCSGEVKVNGEIVHLAPPAGLESRMPFTENQGMKIIHESPCKEFLYLDSRLFLKNIPGLIFRTHMERVSETPMKSIIA